MKKKNKNQNLEDAVDSINLIADAFEQINYMLNNGIPFEIEVEEDSDKNNNKTEDVKTDEDLGFLQDEEDVDDLDFDEMNDVWDEIDEDNE